MKQKREEEEKKAREDKGREEAARIQEDGKARIEHKEKSSGRKWFIGVIIILAAGSFLITLLALGGANLTPSASADQKTITNSIGMEFILIPTGEFDMGSPSNEEGRGFYVSGDFEGPVHHVTISKAFYMGKYEVTQKQWRDIMGYNPSGYKGDNQPVESVSWDKVQDFIKKLNNKEGLKKYRLPTEAEWEYAARAGTTTKYSFGDDESEYGEYAWYGKNTERPQDVGQKKPNPWGLYDMHGNVWEWVQDKLHRNYTGAPTNGSSWESGDESLRVARGGSIDCHAITCRSAVRGSNYPYRYHSTLGFRLVRDL